MSKSILKLSLLGWLTVALTTLPTSTQAKDTNAPAREKKTTKESASPKSSKMPFHGKLKALDKVAKTLSVGEQTLHITAATIITRGDKPATLEDGVVGEVVSGSYLKGEDGKLTVNKLRFGPKPGTPVKTAPAESKNEMVK
jgi:hypothetical protein